MVDVNGVPDQYHEAIDKCLAFYDQPNTYQLFHAEAYRNLWKRHGASLRRLDLSRTARGHWRKEMMSGEETVVCLAQDIVHSGASAIETIDFSEQPKLEGPVLEVFFKASQPWWSTLVTLKLKNCKNASGSIPASIAACVMLQTLDAQGCGFSGALSVRVVEPGLSASYFEFVYSLFCRRIAQGTWQTCEFESFQCTQQ